MKKTRIIFLISSLVFFILIIVFEVVFLARVFFSLFSKINEEAKIENFQQFSQEKFEKVKETFKFSD